MSIAMSATVPRLDLKPYTVIDPKRRFKSTYLTSVLHIVIGIWSKFFHSSVLSPEELVDTKH